MKRFRLPPAGVWAAAIVALAGTVWGQNAVAVSSERAQFRVVKVAGGLEHPWAVAFLPDGRALITERGGRLRLLQEGRLSSVGGLPELDARGQGGLLDVILHPDYARNGWIYFSYAEERRTASRSESGTAVARARLRGQQLADLQVLFRMGRGSTAGVHFGSRLAFLPDGSLVFTIGDRGDRDRAQSLREHAGKSLRLRDDGAVPPDNPFIGAAGALPEIYSTGHRNAQGLAVQPQTGWLWLHEHGPRGGDELNVVEAGRNYGWPLITYGQEYAGGRIGVGTAAAGLEQPVQYWVPSIAPSGLAFYTGEAFPGWQGNLFVGALVGQHLRRLVIEGRRVVHQEVLLQDSIGRIRDVRQGPDGLLYLLTDERDGALYRLEP